MILLVTLIGIIKKNEKSGQKGMEALFVCRMSVEVKKLCLLYMIFSGYIEFEK